MRFFKAHSFIAAACLIMGVSCDTADDFSAREKQKQDALKEATGSPIDFPDKAGMVGIYDMPEILVLSKMDSAEAKDMSFQLAKDYSVLQEEMMAIGAEMNGAPGVINYNSDPKNLKFECILLIKKFPAKQPTLCSIVALEATKMLVYNYYGPYKDLGNAYNEIRKLGDENKLVQTGPMREFYVTDPTTEHDPKKWLTRIMVPVGDANEVK